MVQRAGGRPALRYVASSARKWSMASRGESSGSIWPSGPRLFAYRTSVHQPGVNSDRNDTTAPSLVSLTQIVSFRAPAVLYARHHSASSCCRSSRRTRLELMVSNSGPPHLRLRLGATSDDVNGANKRIGDR